MAADERDWSFVWKAELPRWLKALETYLPDRQWIVKGDKILGLCPSPDHRETHVGSFAVMPSRRFASCLSAACQFFEPNPISFFMRTTALPFSSVANDIVRGILGVKLTAKLEEELDAERQAQELRGKLAAAFKRTLSLALSNPTNPNYAYLQPGVQYLLSRGVDPNMFDALPIGLAPTTVDLCALLSADDVQPALAWVGGQLPESSTRTSHALGAVVFIYESAPFVVSGLKLRPIPGVRPAADVNNESDTPSTTTAPKGIWLGKQSGHRGFFGVRGCQHLMGRDPDEIQGVGKGFVVVEGEFDALSGQNAERAMCGGLPEIGYVAGGGGSTPSLDWFSRLGAQHVVIVGDNDRAGQGPSAAAAQGKSRYTVRNAYRATSGPLTLLSNTTRMDVSVYIWDGLNRVLSAQSVDAKDLDEVVRAGYYASFRDDLVGGTHSYSREAWALHRTQLELQALADKGRADITAKTEVINRYLPALHTPDHKEWYLDALGDSNDIPESMIRNRRGKDTSERDFIVKLKEEITRKMSFLAHDARRNLAHVKTRAATLTLDLGKMTQVVSQLEMTVFRVGVLPWVEERLGLPDFVTAPLAHGKPCPASLPKQIKVLQEYLAIAISELAVASRPIGDLKQVRQGFHFDRADRPVSVDAHTQLGIAQGDVVGRAVVVNGPDTYTTWVCKDRPPVWVMATEGVIGNFLPDTNDTRWSEALSERALQLPPRYTLPALYAKLWGVLNKGWTFSMDARIQVMESKYIAAFLIYAIVSGLMPSTSLLWLVAPSQSGKSTLLLGVACGLERPSCRLVEASNGAAAYTPAGVEQTTNMDSRLFCLDELESTPDDPGKQKVVANLLELLRGLGTGGGAQRIKGSTSGESVRTHLRFPAFAAAINPPTSDANVSRWNFIRLTKYVGVRRAPEEIVLEEFGGTEGVAAFRGAMTLVPLLSLHLFLQGLDAVMDAPWRTQSFPGIDSRFVTVVTPVMATLHACGEDVDAFAYDYLAHKGEERGLYATPQWLQLLWIVMGTPIVRIQGMGAPRSIDSCLRDQALARELNNASIGAYVVRVSDVAGRAPGEPSLAGQTVLVLVGRLLAPNLPGLSDWGNGSPDGVMQILRQSNANIPAALIRKSDIIEEVKNYVSMSLTANDVVALNVKELLSNPSIAPSKPSTLGQDPGQIDDLDAMLGLSDAGL